MSYSAARLSFEAASLTAAIQAGSLSPEDGALAKRVVQAALASFGDAPKSLYGVVVDESAPCVYLVLFDVLRELCPNDPVGWLDRVWKGVEKLATGVPLSSDERAAAAGFFDAVYRYSLEDSYEELRNTGRPVIGM